MREIDEVVPAVIGVHAKATLAREEGSVVLPLMRGAELVLVANPPPLPAQSCGLQAWVARAAEPPAPPCCRTAAAEEVVP